MSDNHASSADKLTVHRRCIPLSVFAIALIALLGAAVPFHTPHLLDTAPACTTAKYRQFDFFAGDWDTYDFADSSKIIARNRVTPMLGGCAVREVYEQNDGVRGESFSMYDAARGVWHQSWVTNGGKLLLLDGGLHNGHMVLIATVPSAAGTSSLLRGVWIPVNGSVRETAERSVDNGKTWTPVFDIVFRPHKQPNGA